MKILIVDDELPARQRIADLLLDIRNDAVLLEAGNGLEAVQLAEKENPDVVLLDIRMPVMDGLESAFHMATLNPAPAVIFVTAYDEHAVRAFEANAVDYLLKPVRLERLKQALDKAALINRSLIGRIEAVQGKTRRTHISAISQGRIVMIPINQIQCFRADNKYVSVYQGGRETLIDESLKDLEEEFAGQFLRIHRNALVSLAHIVVLEKTNDGSYLVQLRDMPEKLTVSRRHIADIRQKLKGQ
jgi:two-component system, LytTR family, response regulator AlgR